MVPSQTLRWLKDSRRTAAFHCGVAALIGGKHKFYNDICHFQVAVSRRLCFSVVLHVIRQWLWPDKTTFAADAANALEGGAFGGVGAAGAAGASAGSPGVDVVAWQKERLAQRSTARACETLFTCLLVSPLSLARIVFCVDHRTPKQLCLLQQTGSASSGERY